VDDFKLGQSEILRNFAVSWIFMRDFHSQELDELIDLTEDHSQASCDTSFMHLWKYHIFMSDELF
jgi:hypothetical protein